MSLQQQSSIQIINNAYRIETERLVIRCWQPNDAGIFYESIVSSLDFLKEWLPWPLLHLPQSELKAASAQKLLECRGKFDLQQDYLYGVFDKDESKVLGMVGLYKTLLLDPRECAIGYWIRKDQTNRGCITEAVGALVQVAFQLLRNTVHRLEIHCEPRNGASASIPRKLGFVHEGTLRSKLDFLGNQQQYKDVMIWAMNEEDYPQSVVASTSKGSSSVIKAVYDACGDPLPLFANDKSGDASDDDDDDANDASPAT